MAGSPEECREHARRCTELARTAKTQAQKQMLSDLSQHWLDQAIALERPQGFPGEEGLPPSPRLPSMWPTRPGKP
jgi:hypothetical protein